MRDAHTYLNKEKCAAVTSDTQDSRAINALSLTVERLILRLESYNQDAARVMRGMWGYPECSEYIKQLTYRNETSPTLHPAAFSILAQLLLIHEDLVATLDDKWQK